MTVAVSLESRRTGRKRTELFKEVDTMKQITMLMTTKTR